MTSISRPGGTSVYIKQESGTISWSSDNINFITISSFPIIVTNTNTAAGNLTVIFNTDLTLTTTSQYIYCNSSNIQIGSSTLNANGSRTTITINNVLNYSGFIDNGNSGVNGFNNISIYNLVVSTSGTTTQGSDGGWIGRANFAKGASNVLIENCSSTGAITGGGGICGGFSASAGGSFTIRNCTSSGAISSTLGGIVGYNSAITSGSSITVQNCSSSGNINSSGGGIFGNNCGSTGGSIVAQNCYSTGNISTSAGGIFGTLCGNGSGGVAIAENCYSTGNITGGGGIFGASAGASSGTAIATNCFSTSLVIASSGGGIFGGSSTNATANNCYTIGSIVGLGGIWAGSSVDNLKGANNYSEGNNSSSGWNDTNAAKALTGRPTGGNPVGSTWAQLSGPNTAYILVVAGYSPYSTTLGTTASSSITVGGSTDPAIVPDYTYSLLAINSSSASSFAYITINSSTGSITAGASTPANTYTILVYSSINPYSITTYTLTVSAAPVTADSGATAEGVSCCAVPMDIGTDVDYETRNKFATGNTMIGGVRGRQPYASYTMLLYKQMAFAAKR